MRAQATGYAGDPNVITPTLDQLAQENVVYNNAVSCTPMCTPYRASLLTGRYPLSTGVFMNDIALPATETTIAHAVKEHGYDTAYIGKWHLDGPQGECFTPPGPRRGGFDHWAGYNMKHDYYGSFYYKDTPEKIPYGDYEPKVQTQQAIDYINSHNKNKPFCLFVSYGPPHDPYNQVPNEYSSLYSLDKLQDRANFMTPYIRNQENMKRWEEIFPIEKYQEKMGYQGVLPNIVRNQIIGYYAHITALDGYVGQILKTLEENELTEDTIFLFTSDHGDMLGSHRKYHKQWPHDESILVPFILRYPRKLSEPLVVNTPINVVDIMPTVLGLADLPIPKTVEGVDLSHTARGKTKNDDPEAALIMAVSPFLGAPSWGMREYRGLRTRKYTYTRSLQGPWHLFDNEKDPYQENNAVNKSEYREVQAKLDKMLNEFLERTNDDFLPAEVHRQQHGIYVVCDNDYMPTY